MKRLIVSLFCLLGFVGNAQAQLLKVSVYSQEKQQAMPYAYLYVNGNAVAVSDSLGVAWIPEAKLHLGDTLIAKYIGARPARIVYTEALKTQGECTLYVSEELGSIQAEEVKVTFDVKAYYFKCLKKIHPVSFVNTLTAPFRHHRQNADGSTRNVSGTFIAGKDPYHGGPAEAPRWIYYNNRLQITTTSDTTGIDTVLRLQIHIILDSDLCRMTNSLNSGLLIKELTNQTTRYGYLGIREGCRVFRLSFFPDKDQTRVLQSLVRMDEKTGIILSSESRWYDTANPGWFSETTVVYQPLKPIGDYSVANQAVTFKSIHRTDNDGQGNIREFQIDTPVVRKKNGNICAIQED